MTTRDWHERAKSVHIDGRAVVGGRRIDAVAGARFDCMSPVDGRKLGEVVRCDASDVDAAVAAARAAFEDGRWAGKAPAERKRILIRFADLMRIVQSDQISSHVTPAEAGA